MISIRGLSKKFDDNIALNNVSVDIEKGIVCGLAGNNGSGKSTLLRLMSGVYNLTEGELLIDGESVYENTYVKENCYYISDYPYFYDDSTLENMAELMKKMYINWDDEKFKELCKLFEIDPRKKVLDMSKGMQRQVAIILAFSCCPKYLFLDEIFDGLDPVIRKLLKKLIIDEVGNREMTCVIASHNLREVDDICEKIVFLHNGDLVANDSIDELKESINKIQIAFNSDFDSEKFKEINCDILSQVGSYYVIIARGDLKEILEKLNGFNPAFIEVVPTSLEEVFIDKMEVAGYGK